MIRGEETRGENGGMRGIEEGRGDEPAMLSVSSEVNSLRDSASALLPSTPIRVSRFGGVSSYGGINQSEGGIPVKLRAVSAGKRARQAAKACPPATPSTLSEHSIEIRFSHLTSPPRMETTV